MECVNCGQENLEKALLCYWCGRDPSTGDLPYPSMDIPTGSRLQSQVEAPEMPTPAAIEIPPPMPVPEINVGMAEMDQIDLTMPDLPTLEIAPPPEIPDMERFTKVQRRRMRHRPVVRSSPSPPRVTRPLLPGPGRLAIFVVGLGVLFFLGSALVGAVGTATFGGIFCLAALFVLAAGVWVTLLFVRAGQRMASAAGATYERVEVLGKALREVAPGVIKELPVNLPSQMAVLDLPVAYSELRYLNSEKGQSSMDLAVALVTGAIATLVGRDDVVLARRTFPVQVRGALTRSQYREVNEAVLTRRRAYVGPGELEERIAQALRTDRPMSVEEFMQELLDAEGRQRVERVLNWVDQALVKHPPNLEALTTPDEALEELERYRTALRRADSELYKLLETEIRRALGAQVRRSVPSSLLDLARYAPTATKGSGSSETRQ